MQLLSIIIPYYNSSATIERTFESCSNLSEDLPIDYEILVINDGSDSTETKRLRVSLEKFSHLPIQYHGQNNKGLPGARNRGIKESNGDYIYFLDADDEILSNGFSKAVLELINRNEDAVFCDYLRFDGKNEIVYSRADYVNFEDLTAFFLAYSCSASMFIFKKELLNEVGGFRNIPAEDKDIAFRISLVTDAITYVKITIFRYHTYVSGSRTNTPNLMLRESLKRNFFLSVLKNLKRKKLLTEEKQIIIKNKLFLEAQQLIRNKFYREGCKHYNIQKRLNGDIKSGGNTIYLLINKYTHIYLAELVRSIFRR